MFVVSVFLTTVDFTLLWRYFSWANQSTAVIALWVGSMYLFIAKRNYWIAVIPGIFMTMACATYILNAPIGLGLSMSTSYLIGAVVTLLITALFFKAAVKARGQNIPLEEDVSDWKNQA